jgi:hypothetical protein
MLIFLDAKENGIFDDGLRFGKLRGGDQQPASAAAQAC